MPAGSIALQPAGIGLGFSPWQLVHPFPEDSGGCSPHLSLGLLANLGMGSALANTSLGVSKRHLATYTRPPALQVISTTSFRR